MRERFSLMTRWRRRRGRTAMVSAPLSVALSACAIGDRYYFLDSPETDAPVDTAVRTFRAEPAPVDASDSGQIVPAPCSDADLESQSECGTGDVYEELELEPVDPGFEDPDELDDDIDDDIIDDLDDNIDDELDDE